MAVTWVELAIVMCLERANWAATNSPSAIVVFASHHPDLVHSLVLDGAYPVTGETAWYPTQGAAMRRAYTVVCERTKGCGDDNTGTMQLLTRLLTKLRKNVVSVRAPGSDDKMHNVRLNPQNLIDVAFGGTYGPTTRRPRPAT